MHINVNKGIFDKNFFKILTFLIDTGTDVDSAPINVDRFSEPK